MCITPNSLTLRHSKGNNFSTSYDILMKLIMPHHTMIIYTQSKFHEIPSIACQQKHENITQHTIYRGSYTSAHVLLNLLNELGKRDKMRGLPSILSLFRNEFDKFNNTRARMLDSIYHMTLRLLQNLISAVKAS